MVYKHLKLVSGSLEWFKMQSREDVECSKQNSMDTFESELCKSENQNAERNVDVLIENNDSIHTFKLQSICVILWPKICPYFSHVISFCKRLRAVDEFGGGNLVTA